MSSETLSQLFRAAADRAAMFRSRTSTLPQAPQKSYREMLALFEEALPQEGGVPREILETLADRAEQGLQMATGPRFFGWVIGSSHPAGVAVDMLASAYGQNTGNHQASPAAAACEAVAARWLLDLLDLPRTASVGFVTGATVANFVCLAAARGEVLRRAGWDADAEGLFGAPEITVLIGEDAHTTVFSALQYLGFGRARVRRIPTDAQGRIIAAAFETECAAITGPAIAVLQAGQINTGDFDPFPVLIAAAHAKGCWVHVDGAFGLWARASAKYASLATGVEEADSWATDGHKWLQTPYDCGFAIVRDELAHRRAMTIAASYLPSTEGDDRDPSHYVPELSRRARGFGTWAVIKALGRGGISGLVERHCEVASAMAARLARDPGISIVNDVVLNQFMVRFGSNLNDEAGDDLTRATISQIQRDGVCFAGGALWRGRQVMRVSVIGFDTDMAEGARSAEAMIAAYQAARSARSSQ
ncbi:MAG: aspartate aminotransferase family protein [Rhizobiales bacterium]|nr:aspartate aminotransferase family protein [Hyphomicrobiales bacterium]